MSEQADRRSVDTYTLPAAVTDQPRGVVKLYCLLTELSPEGGLTSQGTLAEFQQRLQDIHGITRPSFYRNIRILENIGAINIQTTTVITLTEGET